MNRVRKGKGRGGDEGEREERQLGKGGKYGGNEEERE